MDIAVVPYDDMEFIWISDHWDIHIKGLCKYKNRLSEFKIVDEDSETVDYFVYSLGFIDKIKWLTRKKLFELRHGYRWTYKPKQRGSDV
jgi:hypothetical protein